jgi:RHS repeat-associated protein
MKHKLHRDLVSRVHLVFKSLILLAQVFFNRLIVMSVIFSLIFSFYAPLIGLEEVKTVQAAEIGYAPQASTASMVVDGIGSAKGVSITSASTSTTNTASQNNILPSQSHVDESSGAFLWSLPITVPEGRRGLTPSLTLSYDSRRNNVTGYIAKGWELDIPYIQRLNKSGVDLMYERPDFASSTQGELTKLTPMTSASLNQSGFYGANSGYGRYELRNDNTWSMTDTDGTVYVYGATALHREQASNTNISIWYISSITDTSGNKIEYVYSKDAYGRIYPTSIIYADGVHKVTFEWNSSVLPQTSYMLGTAVDYAAGVRPKADRTLKSISIISDSQARMNYQLTYTPVTSYTNQTGYLGPNTTTNVKKNVTKIQVCGASSNTFLEQNTNGSMGNCNLNETYTFGYSSPPMVTSSPNTYWYGGSTTFTQLSVPTTNPIFPANQNGAPAVGDNFTPKWMSAGSASNSAVYSYVDLDGDGWKENVSFSPVTTSYTTTYTMNVYGINTAKTGYELKPAYLAPFVSQSYGPNVNIYKTQMGDIDGDGDVDMIFNVYESVNGALVYVNKLYRNTGNAFVLDSTVSLPNTPTAAQNTFLRDINGDNKADLVFVMTNPSRMMSYISTGTEFISNPEYTAVGGNWTSANGSNSSPIFLIDINGDHLEDIIRFSEVFLNRKTHFEFSESYSLVTNSITSQGQLIDINGDGLVDVPSVTGFGTTAATSVGALINTGLGWKYIPDTALTTVYNYSGQYGEITESQIALQIYNSYILNSPVDLNSDGFFDIVNTTNSSSNPVSSVRIHPGTRENMMTSVTIPSGNTTTVTYGYELLKNTNTHGSPQSQYVVKSIIDSTTPVNTITYTYENGLQFSNNEDMTKKFAGFEKVTTVNTEGIKEVSYYHQGNTSNTSLGEFDDNKFKIGREYRTETYTPANVLAKTVITKWSSGDLGSGRGLVVPETVLSRYTLGGTYDTATGYTYDTAYGKVVRVHDFGLVTGSNDGTFTDTGNDKQTTDYKYVSNGTIVKQSLSTKKDQNGKVLSQTATIYDGGILSKGLPTEVNQWIDSATTAKTKYTYTSSGLPATMTDPMNALTSFVYDTYKLHPKTVTNPLGQVTTYNSYDYFVGKLTKVSDPSGIVMQYSYDAYGREVNAKRNNIDIRSSSYSPTNHHVSYSNNSSNSNSFSITHVFDALGRLTSIQDAKKGYTYYTYNSSGRRITESVPNATYGNASGLITTYTYDALGRIVSATNSLGTTNTVYNGLTKTITIPNGVSTTYTYDVRGNLLSVIENSGSSTDAALSTYTYDGNGKLVTLTDAEGNKREFVTNLRGDVLSATDLHTATDTSFGIVKKQYDLNARLLKTTLQDAKIITHTYDALGRITTKVSGSITVPEETITYTYDTCMSGMLCSAVSSLGVGTSYTYSPEGFVASKTQTIDGIALSKSYTYDNQGQILSVTEPDGTVVTYDRTMSGANIQNLSVDGVTLLYQTTYDIESRIKTLNYLASPTYNYLLTTTYTYDQTKMMQLVNQKTTLHTTNTDLINTTYTYDSQGNITNVLEAGHTSLKSNKSYTYDAYDRLTGYTTTPTGGSTSPADGGTYMYSKTGNMTTSGTDAYSYGPLSQSNNNQNLALARPESKLNQSFFASLKNIAKKSKQILALINPFHAEVAYAVYTPTCTPPKVVNTITNTCMNPPPDCIQPNVIVPINNSCALPVVCTLPAVRDNITNTCVTFNAPICTPPQVLVPVNNTCALPVTCSAPLIRNQLTNTCVTTLITCVAPKVINQSGTQCINPNPPICISPQVYNPSTNSCQTPISVSCPAGMIYTTNSNSCQIAAVCDNPQVLNTTTNRCEMPLTISDVQHFLRTKGFGSQQSGRALIKAGYNKVTISFKNPFLALPLISAIPTSKISAGYYLSDITSSSFRIKLIEPALEAISFVWNALEDPNDDGFIVESEDDNNGLDPFSMVVNTDDSLQSTLNNQNTFIEIPPTNNQAMQTSSFTSPQARTKKTTPTGDILYAYDTRGNLISESIPTTTLVNNIPTVVNAVTIHEWNTENKITKTTLPNGDIILYRYAPDGTRVQKKIVPATISAENPIKITTYMDKEFEKDEIQITSTTSPTTDSTRTRIMLGSVHVATIDKKIPPGSTTPTVSRYYQLTNTVGSSTITVDTTGAVIQAQDTKPYGGYRVNTDTKYIAPTPATATTGIIAGTTGTRDYYALHERDIESGLTYMNARSYDETMPTFLSLDPTSQYNPQSILQDPQQLNLYAYARGNPIKYNDPSGEFIMKTGKIEKGDTLGGITNQINKKYGTKYTVSQIAKANGIKNANLIHAGKSIILPKSSLQLRFNNSASTLYVMDKTYGNGYNDLKWSATSGGTKLNFAPIATGNWQTVDPSQIQYWDSKSDLNQSVSNLSKYTKFIGVKMGGFPGGTDSWGTQRTELNNIDTGQNNTGFYIHGGTTPGSMGCIDLVGQNDSFHNWFRSNGTALDLVVE